MPPSSRGDTRGRAFGGRDDGATTTARGPGLGGVKDARSRERRRGRAARWARNARVTPATCRDSSAGPAPNRRVLVGRRRRRGGEDHARPCRRQPGAAVVARPAAGICVRRNRRRHLSADLERRSAGSRTGAGERPRRHRHDPDEIVRGDLLSGWTRRAGRAIRSSESPGWTGSRSAPRACRRGTRDRHRRTPQPRNAACARYEQGGRPEDFAEAVGYLEEAILLT